MTRLDISIDPSIVAPELPEGSDLRLATHQYYLDKMGEALATERGMRLRYPSAEDAKGQRFKFYRARRFVARQGIKSFDRLTFLVEDNCLLLKKDITPEVELL